MTRDFPLGCRNQPMTLKLTANYVRKTFLCRIKEYGCSKHLKMRNIRGKFKSFSVKLQHKKYLNVNLKTTPLLTLLNLLIQPQVPPNQPLVLPYQLQIQTNLLKNLRLNHF